MGKMRLNSIQTKVVLWTGICLLLTAAVIVGYAATTLRRHAMEDAETRAVAETRTHANYIRAQIEIGLDAARTLAQVLASTKHEQHPVQLTRDEVNSMLRGVLEQNPAFVAVYTLWEPNAFDGKDVEYANTVGHDATGQFVPYWSRSATGEIEVAPLLGYEPGGEFNPLVEAIARDRREVILDPYLYPVQDEQVLMTSVLVPIVAEGQYYGLVGIDLPLDFIQQLADQASVYGGVGELALISNNGTLAGVTGRPELVGKPYTDLHSQGSMEDIARLAQTQEPAYGFHEGRLEVFAPIRFGNTATPWLVNALVPEAAITAPATAAMWRMVGTGAIMAVTALVLLWFAAGQVARPIRALTNVAETIAGGNLEVEAPATSKDETGVLARTFNQMTTRLRETIGQIQARSDELAERTRELEASQRVTFAASERVTPDELLDLVVNLIRDQFNLYHAQVYIVDKEQKAAVLRQSTGYAGRQLLQRKHQIPLDATALVTKAIATGEAVLVADVSQDPNFMPNPLLPETRSELVVPLKQGDEVIGALDAQDRIPGRFGPSTVNLFESMADQIAILFENSRLLERITEQTEALTVFTNQLRTAAEIARRLGAVLDPDQLLEQVVELLQSRFGLYHAHIYVVDEMNRRLVMQAGSGEVGRVLRKRGHAIPLDAEKGLVARAAREQVTVLVNDASLDSDFLPNPLLPQTRSEVAIPLLAGDKTLGVLDVQDDQANRFTQADVDTFTTLAGQIATALQTAGLFEQTRLRLQVSQALATAQTEDEVLDVLIRQMEIYPNTRPTIFMVVPEAEELTIAVRRQAQYQCALPLLPEGMRAPISQFPMLKDTATGKPFITSNLLEDKVVSDPATRETARQMGVRSVISQPLMTRGQFLGVISVSSPEVGYFDEQKLHLYQILAEQGATALHIARLREEQQKLASVVQYSTELVNLATLDGTMIFLNEAGGKMLGINPAEVGRHNIMEVIPEHLVGMVQGELLPAIMEKGTWEGELQYRNVETGALTDVHAMAFAIRDPRTNAPLYLANVSRDIAERKRAEQQIAIFKALAENASDAVGMADLEGRLIYANRAFYQQMSYDYEQQEMIGRPLVSIWPEEDLPVMTGQVLPQVMTGGWSGESRVKRRDGSVFDAQVSAFPVLDEGGRPICMAAILRDITDRKQAEAERERFTAQLSTAAEVAGQIASILDPDKLLNTVINLIHDRFNLYHVHFYRLDEAAGDLVLQAGYGDPGRIMLEQGHKIPLDREQSLVARAARTREPVVVHDVTQAPDFLPNPLLPETRSEVAVPAIAGGKVLGVFDVQHSLANYFTGADVNVFTTLAGQIATALENASAFEQTQTRLRVSQALASAHTEEEVLDVLIQQAGLYPQSAVVIQTIDPGARELTLVTRRGAAFDSGLMMPPDGSRLTPADFPLLQRVSSDTPFVTGNLLHDERIDPMVRGALSQMGLVSFAALPLTAGTEWLGVVAVSSKEEGYFDERKLNLYRTLAEQGAVALRTARLRDAVQHNLDETRVRFEVSQALAGAHTEEEVLDALLQQAGMYPKTQVMLFTTEGMGEEMVVTVRRTASFESNLGSIVQPGMTFPMSQFALVMQHTGSGEFVSPNLPSDERADPVARQMAAQMGTVSMAIVPMLMENNVIGDIVVSSEQEAYFDERKLSLYRTLAEQGAVALRTARLYDETQKTAERLAEVDRLKSEFLASMSHELRTPLNSIIGYTEIMLMGIDAELDPELREDVQAIYDNGQHLLRIINDVLDLAKIEAGRLTLNMEEVPIQSVVDAAASSVAGLLVNKPVEFRVEADGDLPVVWGDQVRLNQILNNLTSNAVKFTDEGHITLRAFSDDGWVCLEVEDTGIGISEADQRKLFERFQQIEGSNARKKEGTGLGLAITRHLVNLHGGTIAVKSRVGEGSTFTVRLPIHTPAASSAAPAQGERAAVGEVTEAAPAEAPAIAKPSARTRRTPAKAGKG